MKKVAMLVCAMMMLAGNAAWPVAAVPSDEVIKMNCQSAQTILNQLEKADAALRINRGRIYNEVADLFYAMNSRLASNRISSPELVTITEDFESELEHFRTDYNSYDDTMSELIQMKCQDKPSNFYNKLSKARDQRATLAEHVQHLDEVIKDYQDEFNSSARAMIDAR